MKYYFNGVERFDLFFENPNATALFLLGIISVIFLLRDKCLCSCVFDVVLLLVYYYILETYSRSGVLCVFVFFCVLIVFSGRFKRYYILSLLIFGIMYCLHPALDRMLISTSDASVENRIEIWKHAFAMLYDAPDGWGWGNSGKAYMNFYQDIKDFNAYKTLVNSHITILSEVSWFGRVIYVIFWVLVFWYLYPKNQNYSKWICYAYIASFFVGCCFSSLYHFWLLLALPIVYIGFLALKLRSRIKFSLFPVLFALIICSSLCVPGIFIRDDVNIMHSKKFTVIGNGNYNILVIPNERVMGTIYGKTLRKLAHEFQNIKFWIPNNDYHTNDIDVNLIIATDLPKYLAQKKCDVILLNPRHEYNNFGESHLEIYRGEFSASSHKNIQNESNYTLLEGVGDFIPSWKIIIEKKLSSIFIP